MTTWKDIASYIGRDGRTARRYEVERNLPIHRMPGESRSVVYAHSDELDTWLRRQEDAPGAAAGDARPPIPTRSAVAPSHDRDDGRGPSHYEPHDLERLESRSGWRTILSRSVTKRPLTVLLVASCIILVVTGVGHWRWDIRQQRGLASTAANQSAEGFYRAGEYAWRQRTPEALKLAVDDFTQAIVRRPDYAPAYVGLANSYDLMPEYGSIAPAYAYPRAEAAARQAIALSHRSADAHATLGFVRFWWQANVAGGLAELAEAVRLDPNSAQDHHWYANALAEMHDRRAQEEIDEARRLDPDSTPILLDSGWVSSQLGEWHAALATFAAVEAVHPDLPLLHFRLSELARRTGRYPEMLKESARAAELAGDRIGVSAAHSAEVALRAGGAPSMWSSLAATGEQRYAAGQVTPGLLAGDELHAGHLQRSLQLLTEASKQHEAGIVGLGENSDFSELRTDARFRRLLMDLGRGIAS